MLECIIIGAGPGGLVSTKELLEQNVKDVLCLEQSSSIGGVFSKSYDSLRLTSSSVFSMFSDYWIGNGFNHHFWSKEEVLEYWKGYAKHFGVLNHIRFDSKVQRVLDHGKSWRVYLTTSEIFECKRLILAIGNNNVVNYPDWHQDLVTVDYSHSKEYKNSDKFYNKRVLIVGGGESGSDIAYEVSAVAKECWVSLRESTGWVVPRKRGDHASDISTHRGIWGLPREYGEKLSPHILELERARKDPVFDALADLNDMIKIPRGIWGTYGTKTLALPKAIANHGCKIVRDIVEVNNGGKQLKSSCGKFLNNIDAVIFCTGYKNQISFMPEELNECDPRQLFKHMFHSELQDRIAWIGWARPGFGSQFPIMELQARFCAGVFSGTHQLPDRLNMIETAKNDASVYEDQFEHNAIRIRSLVDYFRYMDDIAKLIGCEVPLNQYFWRHPLLWIKLVYGPMQATQFRLRGPGQKVKLAQKILHKIPRSSFNHIVKAGLRGRLYYLIKYLLNNKTIRIKSKNQQGTHVA